MDDSPAALRARFAQLADFAWQSDWPLDSRQVPAAVLVPLVPRPQGMQVLLTRRTDHLHHHAGQISFPGGRMEEEDVSLSATALREASEEVGLLPESVELLGVLPDFGTPSGFRITPVLGLLHPDVCLRPDPFEVAEAFEIPLQFLARHSNYQSHRIRWQAGERHVYAVPYPGRFIWGATAGILHMLAAFLADRPGGE
ncbi:CoA pyrophosphatase [Uliginosibacterium sp. 31-16]|uniref:CoA pyrophosphatase n=1 Tax=Uliginosibacterium sp. 31-16 TaxID=3068315 RepID=UPI00273F7A0B|nr:CoA pyrophosphatase [Uliginosibacterium sp. 31-16]MDP5240410.1 CoA pyrophosphatase [Uliginosibacterium sp. 31-16]